METRNWKIENRNWKLEIGNASPFFFEIPFSDLQFLQSLNRPIFIHSIIQSMLTTRAERIAGMARISARTSGGM